MFASDSLDTPGCHIPFSLELILADLEGESSVGPILPSSLADLLHKTGGRGSGGGGSGDVSTVKKESLSHRGAKAHLPSLSLTDGENSYSILTGTVIPALHGAVL